MEKREKVIEALEACVLKDPDDSRDCRHCPRCNYGAFITNSCINGVMADALALLKAQEPRAMTLEEAKSASGYVIVQSRSCNILELQLFKDGFVYDSFAVPIAVDYLWWEGYNKHWRLWTSRPTDEQMEATPWQES